MKRFFTKIDWWIVFSIIPLLIFSLSSLHSFSGENNLFTKQIVVIIISFFVFLIPFFIDISFLKKSKNIFYFYFLMLLPLVFLLFFGQKINGAKSWISLGSFTFQPADIMKFMLVLILAKYLARRHVEIKSIKHIFITALYFFVPFFLIFLQPDFGSAIILFGIWFGMIMVSGISKKHLFSLFILGIALSSLLWTFALHDYQKKRILNFIYPLSDIRGTGYNVYQSTLAVGSGRFLGKGVGYGTQSRLSFLPENETDFIFAAIAEEWGFVGSLIIILLLFFIIIRILINAHNMQGNFELLFSLGVAFYFMTHIIINIGMNIGIMPVTGVTLPFVSYGGSHILIEFLALGFVMAMRGRDNIQYYDIQSDIFLEQI